MIGIFFSLILWIPATCGLGCILVSLSRGQKLHFSFPELSFIGMSVLSILSSSLHFFFPMSQWINLAFLIIGIVGLVYFHQFVRPAFSLQKNLLMFLLFVSILMVASRGFVVIDTGGYYLQNVLWNYQSPLVLGLGNLHGRLAYNSEWFMFSSSLWLPLLDWTGVFSSNALLALVFLYGIAEPLLEEKKHKISVSDWFRLSCFLFLVAPASGREFLRLYLGSFCADFPVSLLICYSFCLALDCLNSKQQTAAFSLLVLICSFCITIKASAIPIFLLPLLVLIMKGRELLHSANRVILVTAGLLFAVWALQSLGLSGCLIYPASFTCVDLPWSIPIGIVMDDARWITSWARRPGLTPDEVLGNWDWLPHWRSEIEQDKLMRSLFYFLVSGLILLLVVHMYRHRRSDRQKSFSLPSSVILFVVSLAGICFSLVNAPHQRFAYGFLFAGGLLPLSVGLQRIPFLQHKNILRFTAIAVVLSFFWIRASQSQLIDSKEIFGKWPRIPRVAVDEKRNIRGTVVRIPLQGECWATPVPCSTYLNENLLFSEFLGRQIMRIDSTSNRSGPVQDKLR